MQVQPEQTGKRTDRKALITAAIFCVPLIILISMADRLSGEDFSLAIAYLLPIFVAAWFAGKRSAMLAALLSAVGLLVSAWRAEKMVMHPLIYAWDLCVNLAFFLAFAVILATLKQALRREREMARTDSLTGAANVRTFMESAGGELNKALRYNRPISVAFLDIDNFKSMNDRFGHTMGNQLLQVTADAIREILRKTDMVARLGGDEFAILLPETGYETSEAVLDRMHKKLVEAVQQRGWPVTFSIGIATFLIPPPTVDELIKRADSLMYAVKQGGKNMVRHEVFSI